MYYNDMRSSVLPLSGDTVFDHELPRAGGVDDWHGKIQSVVLRASWDREPEGQLTGHAHGSLELGMVLLGQSTMIFEGAELRCDPGYVWVCSMWEQHAWHVRDSGGTAVAVIFHPDLLLDQPGDSPPYLDLFALPPSQRPRVQDEDVRKRVLAIGREIEREHVAQAPYWQEIVRLGLLRILAELSRASLSASPDSRAEMHQRHGAVGDVMPAIKLIHEQPWRRITAADAAALCTLSTSLFHRTFRRAMGVGFAQFRLRVRVAYAAHRLIHTDHTVEQIAEEAGFTDFSHMNRVFRARYGYTPGQYRDLGC